MQRRFECGIKAPPAGGSVALAVACFAACLSSLAETPVRTFDPGVRPGATRAGSAVAGVDSRYFANTRSAFQEVHSIAGDLEPGVDLGPRFNGTSCRG